MDDHRQPAPQLGNEFRRDHVLRDYLRRTLPPDVRAEVEPELDALGELAGGELYREQLTDRRNEPTLVRWDAWGERVDRIEPTSVWRRAERLAAELGVVATAYECRHGRHSRPHQFALAYLFTPSTDIYSCPLAMTDGAAATLIASGNRPLVERAVPRLTARDPARFWTSGQWMTELAGGSDVGRSRTEACRVDGGGYALYGRKWFTSAAASQMALTLARPEGNPGGGRGLALFYLETRDADGRPRRFRIHRLKDKLGTRKLPTAEITLEGTPAELVAGTTDGVRAIAPMLNVTRTWNAVSAIALMRRGLSLAFDYAERREAFGARLIDQPLHRRVLDDLAAEFHAAFHLTFGLIEILGRVESGEAEAGDAELLRLLTPIVKLTTAKQAVAVLSEVLECFGGAGYVEDTGLPTLLRDAQVLPIWEGTTSVLALDLLRSCERLDGARRLSEEVERALATSSHEELAPARETVRAGLHRALDLIRTSDRPEPEARHFALQLGRTLAAAYLLRQAGWELERDESASLEAATRFLNPPG